LPSPPQSRTPHEDKLVLPLHDDLKDADLELVDTHCHIHSTFQACESLSPAEHERPARLRQSKSGTL